MNIVFLMDQMFTIKKEKDTSFAFMEGAAKRGHAVFYLNRDGLSLHHGELHARVLRVQPDRAASPPFQIFEGTVLSGSQIDAVFIRTDPPFNQEYLLHTWLLEHLPKTTPVINRPSGIRTVNEKIWAMQFTDLQPTGLLTQHYDDAAQFLAEHGRAIMKPTDGFGGMGVFDVRQDDSNARVIFETLSNHGSNHVIIQQHVPEAATGDKRILLLGGEPLGAVLRVHGQEDHRNNFFAGGRPQPTEITERDLQIIGVLRPYLRELGLYFVGIDVIGNFLIEVNVTSPTCLQEMNAIYGRTLEDEVIRYIEDLAESYA